MVEQLLYTAYGITLFLFAYTYMSPGQAASELAIYAILQIAVPFHAISSGWKRVSSKNPIVLVPYVPAQVALVLTTFSFVLVFSIYRKEYIDAGKISIFISSSFSVILASQFRWNLIRLKCYNSLIVMDIMMILSLPLLLYFNSYGFSNPVVLMVFTSKILFSFFSVLVLFSAQRSAKMLWFDYGGGRIELRDFALAAARYLRNNGLFPLSLFAISPEVALEGRLLQYVANFLRLSFNPLGNVQFFHTVIPQSFFNLAILFLGLCGGCIAILASHTLHSSISATIWFMLPLAVSASYLAAFKLRTDGRKTEAVIAEGAGVIAFTAIVFSSMGKNPYAIGLVASEIVLVFSVLGLSMIKGRVNQHG